MLYSTPQLRLLILLAVTLLVGLGVREWRAGFPDAADRLERFDQEEPAAAPLPEPRPDGRAEGGSSSAQPLAAPQGASVAPASPGPPRPLDLNRADATELARLPGVGPGLAQRIVEERARRGRFESPEALRGVLGMGPKKLAAIRGLVTVSD